MGYTVDLVMSDIGIQYQGVAHGDLDLMLMAWLPTTHRNYWRKVSDKVIDLGPLYLDARLGWVVPDYVPKDKLDSIADLADAGVARRLNRRIYGIDPGSGLMQASEKALQGYGLSNYELVASSGAGMTAALKRGIRRHRWVVATAWSPHWIFQKWHLRYLKDPKHLLGGRQEIHAVARMGFNDTFDPRPDGIPDPHVHPHARVGTGHAQRPQRRGGTGGHHLHQESPGAHRLLAARHPGAHAAFVKPRRLTLQQLQYGDTS